MLTLGNLMNTRIVEVLHLLEELRSLSSNDNHLLNQNEILLLERTIIDKIRLNNPSSSNLSLSNRSKDYISEQITEEFKNVMIDARLNSSRQKRVLNWIQERFKLVSNKDSQTNSKSVPASKDIKNSSIYRSKPIPPTSSPNLNKKMANKSTNWLDQLWLNLREELTINWFLFLGAFMVFASGLFYCFLTWTTLTTIQQFLASLGGIAFFFTLEFILSRGLKLIKSPRIFAIIFVLFLPLTLWVQVRLGFAYYLIGLCFGIPALYSLKKRYYPAIDRAWFSNISLLMMIPLASNIDPIQSESIKTSFIILACLFMLIIQHYWQKRLIDQKLPTIPTAITAWFYVCLHFCFFSIFSVIFALYAVCIQLAISIKPPKFASGFTYGSFVAMVIFCVSQGNFYLPYFGIALLLLCMHKIHFREPNSIGAFLTQISSMIWIFLCPLVINTQSHIELFIISNYIAIFYFICLKKNCQFWPISRCLAIYSVIPLPIFYASSGLLSLHLFTITILIHYLANPKTEEDLLTEGLIISLGLLPILSWCPCRFGLISSLWLAICIFLKKQFVSIKPFTLLTTSFLIIGTIDLAYHSQHLLTIDSLRNPPENYVIYVIFHAILAFCLLSILSWKKALPLCLTLWQLPILVLAVVFSSELSVQSLQWQWTLWFSLSLLILQPKILGKITNISQQRSKDLRCFHREIQKLLIILFIPSALNSFHHSGPILVMLGLFLIYRNPFMVWISLSISCLSLSVFWHFISSNTLTLEIPNIIPFGVLCTFHLLVHEKQIFNGTLQFLLKWNRLFTLINLILLTCCSLFIDFSILQNILIYLFVISISCIQCFRWKLNFGFIALPVAYLDLMSCLPVNTGIWSVFIIISGLQYIAVNYAGKKYLGNKFKVHASDAFIINQIILLILFIYCVTFPPMNESVNFYSFFLCLLPLLSFFSILQSRLLIYLFCLKFIFIHALTVSFDFWGLLILTAAIYPTFKKLKGNIFIWKCSLYLLISSTFIYVINLQDLGVLLSFGCSGIYFLIEAYLRREESNVYVGFSIFAGTFALAKSFGYLGSSGLTTYFILGISLLFYWISPRLKTKLTVFKAPLYNIARVLPLLAAFLEYFEGDSPIVYLISGIFYHMIQDDSKLSYTRLLALLSFNLCVLSISQTSGFIVEIISICGGFSVLWYAKSLEGKVSVETLKVVKLLGNIWFYFGALFNFVFNVSLEHLLFCWLICALGGWLALLTRAKMQIIFAASIFVITLGSFVIKQLYLEVSSGIPLIAGIGISLIFIAIFMEKFKDTWAKIVHKMQRYFSDWSD